MTHRTPSYWTVGTTVPRKKRNGGCGQLTTGLRPQLLFWSSGVVLLVSVSTSGLPVIANRPDTPIEFATDIADVYPKKEVTLAHSRDQLLPRFDKWMHDTSTVPLLLLLLFRMLTVCVHQLWIASAR